MILGFSTKIDGAPTYFPEKILAGLMLEAELSKNHVLENDIEKFIKEYAAFKNSDYETVFDEIEIEMHGNPKYHTIRDDEKEIWQENVRIDFYINIRKPDMFRFAPIIPVNSVQEVFMTYRYNDFIQISIDGKELFGYTEREQFAKNDGFDSWEQFFNYFYPKIISSPKKYYKGKLINWTDLKY